MIEAWSLASSPDPAHHHPTILFYTHGALAAHLTNTLLKLSSSAAGSSPQSAGHDFLAAFFRPYFAQLPQYSASSLDCVPCGIVATDWMHDELAGWGSFCNFPVGAHDAEADVEAVRHGWPESGVWFAGEHAAPVGELGTVAGAWLSGESVAARVADKYGLGERAISAQERLGDGRVEDLTA